MYHTLCRDLLYANATSIRRFSELKTPRQHCITQLNLHLSTLLRSLINLNLPKVTDQAHINLPT